MDDTDQPTHLIGVIESCVLGQLGLLSLLRTPTRQICLFTSPSQAQSDPVWAKLALVIIGPSHSPSEALQIVRDLQRSLTKQAKVTLRFLVFSLFSSDSIFQIDAAYSGVAGCIATPVLSKQQAVDQITILLNGQTLFAPEIIQAVRDIETPSQRELEVLRLMADYCTSGEIASQLSISPKTVDGHVARIFARLQVNGRRAAIHRAKHLGWIK